jgi:predicted Zn-dependent protease
VSSALIDQAEMEAAPQIGRATAATFLQGNIMLLAPDLEVQVQKLTEELTTASSLSVHPRVHLVNSSLVNLMTLPSGDLFVFTGFLEKIDNRDELAFGLAHELAHLHLGHGLNQVKAALDLQRQGTLIATILANLVAGAAGGATHGALAIVSVGGLPQVAEFVANLAAKIPEALVTYIVTASLSSHSQAQELEADQWGLSIMRRAGYNPAAALTVMEKFSEAWHAR